ncbi:hypothetical protein pEaSNUABM37_00344 [Erwinia phage pEa_SNUABM_37]|nr:hypothetical protein pEaSNUABM37_00344 [Erwinia phage pEa_SNUABM_37]QXO10812.1 hypothetical protein pEaSNUABM48_00344 [Erwinia phage pEa_SNUABM_48]
MTILKQPSDQIILAQLNKDNNVSLTMAQVRFGRPDQVLNPVNGDTNLPILAKPGGGYVGSVLGNFNRLDLDALFRFKVILTVPSLQDVSDVVAAFNERYGLGIDASEVLNNPINPDDVDQDGNIIYTIVTNNSRAYQGQVTVAIIGLPAGAIMTENDFALMTEDGRYLVVEGS